LKASFAAFDFDGFRHLLYRKDDSSVIIISRPVETFLERIAPFSYLFILFFALVVIFYMLTSRRPLTEIFGLNFKRRVQVSMIHHCDCFSAGHWRCLGLVHPQCVVE
jgi:hypothetical protein